MKRMIDSLCKEKFSHRVWRFRARVPDLTLRYISPPPTIFSSWTKWLGVLVALFMGPAMTLSFSTNAAFRDEDRLRLNDVGTGAWVPDIHLEEEHDCVRLTSSLDAAIMYYKFSHDGDPRTDGAIFEGECLKIPQKKVGKEILFEAIAFHPENDQWRSHVLMRTLSSASSPDRDRHRQKQSDREQSDTKRGQTHIDIEHDAQAESDNETDRDDDREELCRHAHDGENGQVAIDGRMNVGNCERRPIQEGTDSSLSEDTQESASHGADLKDSNLSSPRSESKELLSGADSSGQIVPDVLQKDG